MVGYASDKDRALLRLSHNTEDRAPKSIPGCHHRNARSASTRGNPISSFDISWVNPERAEYYLADGSNKGIDVIDTDRLTFSRRVVPIDHLRGGGSMPATVTARSM